MGRPKDEELAARRREEILRHAITHFARDGYERADVGAIAADIGCSKGTLYRYFTNKSDLFRHTVDQAMKELIAVVFHEPPEDPIQQIEQEVRRFLAHFDEHPEYVELFIQERAVFRDRSQPTYFRYREAYVDRLKKRYLKLMKNGRMRVMPAERALDVLGDLLYGTIFVNYFAGRRKTLEQQASDILEVVFHGLLTQNEMNRRRKPGAPAAKRVQSAKEKKHWKKIMSEKK